MSYQQINMAYETSDRDTLDEVKDSSVRSDLDEKEKADEKTKANV